MIRVFCDRCGIEVEDVGSIQVLIEYKDDIPENDDFDLCRDCTGALVKWFSLAPREDRTAAQIFNLDAIIRDAKGES